MKLTDFLEGIGRPATYYPSLRKITGGTTATLFLCQLIYWKGKEADPGGWIYKTAADMEDETGLSYEEQKTARRKLIEANLIEEHYARLDHQMKFRVNFDALNERWGNGHPPVPERGNALFGNAESQGSLNESYITAENTESLPKVTEIDFENMTIHEAYKLPTLRMYRNATGFFPGMPVWEFVHNFIVENKITEKTLKAVYAEWKLRGFKSENVRGILEWARDGIPGAKKQGQKTKNGNTSTPATVVSGTKRFLERHKETSDG
jgi:hypothetical protein